MATTPPSPRPTTTAAAPPKIPQYPPHNAPRVWFMTDGLAPIAISLSRYLLEHGDYVVAGTLPSEFEAARGEGLRNFMGEVAREGRDKMNEADERGGMDGMDGMGVIDGMELGGEKEGEGEEKGEAQKKRRKRWRDRFRVVRLDGRLVCSSTRV